MASDLEIASALHKRAATGAASSAPGSSSHDLNGHIALFAKELAARLNASEIQALFKFLDRKSLRVASDERSTKLTLQFEQLWDTFQAQEIQCSGQDPQKLTSPSGLLDAEIGVILHVLHYNPEEEDEFTGVPKPFWDPYSRSIEVLVKKGFSGDQTFGMDWHHRATLREMGCPLKMWSKEVRRCHDSFSQNVLNLIPCALLMIAGSCAWENYSAAIKHKSKMISFEAAAGVELVYALEFEDEKMLSLRRITAKVDHPSYGFNQPRRVQHIAKRFDTQSNLMLYLGGRKFNANSYRQAIGDVELGRKRSAPLRELWAYRSIEEKQKTPLREADFDSSFLIWVRGHLTPRRTKILFETGESVLVPILTAIKKKQSNLAFERAEVDLILKGLALREGVRKFVKPRVRGTLYLETTILHFKLSVPYEEQDAKSIRESNGINVDLKVEFIDDLNSKTLAAPNAGPSDSAQGLRIEVNYEIQRGWQTVPVRLYYEPKKTAKLHIRLCQMNTLADAVTAKSSRYTRLQPHRLILTSEKGNGYTSCQSTDCEVCAGFEWDKYIKKTRDGNGLWVKDK